MLHWYSSYKRHINQYFASGRETFYRKEFCGPAVQSEQYEMFRYTPVEDLEAIFRYRNDPRLKSIVEDILSKKWHDFLASYIQIPEEAHFILLAAYRYGSFNGQRLSATTTATAFYFLSMAIDDPDYELTENPENLSMMNEKTWKSIPPHEQIWMIMKIDRLSKNALDIFYTTLFETMQGAFTHRFTCSIYTEAAKAGAQEFLEIGSITSLEKCLFDKMETKLTINAGFPTRHEYIDAIFKGQNPYSLISPYSRSPRPIQYLHGAKIEHGSAWVSRHDAVHLLNRDMAFEKNYPGELKKQFEGIIRALQAILDARPAIQVKLIEEGYIQPHLDISASADDLATRIIDELLIQYLDCELAIALPTENNQYAQTFDIECKLDIKNVCDFITSKDLKLPEHDRVLSKDNKDIVDQAKAIAAKIVIPAMENIVFPDGKKKQKVPV